MRDVYIPASPASAVWMWEALSGCGKRWGWGSWESRDSEEAKILLGPQWDVEEKRRCTENLGFHWREIPPVPEPAARRSALLWLLSPRPSLDFSPLGAGAGAMWQLGEQVLPRRQENISAWVENAASVGSWGWQGAGCLWGTVCQAGEESKPRLRCSLLSIPSRNQVIIASSLITHSFPPSRGGGCLRGGETEAQRR